MEGTRSLTVLYDESCPLCRRCRDWLLTQPCLVPVQLLPAGSPDVRSRYAAVAPWLGKELVTVDDGGRAWVGPAAFVTCLWCTARYRSWAYLLARPSLAPLSDHFFIFVTKRRNRFGRWIDRDDAECSWCDEVSIDRDVR